MRTIPRTILKKIEFFEFHIDQWAANAEALGLTDEAVALLGERLAAARAAYDTAWALRQQAKSATTTQTSAVESLTELGSALVATIRAKAKLTGDDAMVYAAAELSPAKTPAPLPPPAVAESLQSTLLNSGALRIDWEGTTANGTCYTVWRRLGAAAPPTLLGAVCTRSFVDDTLPAVTPEATYFVRAHRGELTSDDSMHIAVRFGVAGRDDTDISRRTCPADALVRAA